MKEDFIHSLQKHVEVDEPESGSGAGAGHADRAISPGDVQFDRMTEEDLLRGLEGLVPPAETDDDRNRRSFRSGQASAAIACAISAFLLRHPRRGRYHLGIPENFPEMMRQYELVDRVRRYNPSANEDLLNRAYVYAMKAHGAQTRASGDPYFSHPLEVAAILTDLSLDDATIVAAVLHDTIEDTGATREEIDELFGPEIGALVDGLTKIKKLDLVSKHAEQAENFRKLLLAIADDVRVLLVKLADRLHNMRTLHFVPPEKRARIAEETLDIYAPLAGRMGMQAMRDELEDLVVPAPQARGLRHDRRRGWRICAAENGELIGAIEPELAGAAQARHQGAR